MITFVVSLLALLSGYFFTYYVMATLLPIDKIIGNTRAMQLLWLMKYHAPCWQKWVQAGEEILLDHTHSRPSP